MGIHVDNVLIYGSHALGNASQNSDIDLIVISPDWENFSQRERLEMLGIASARILEPVQASGFTPQEIDSKSLSSFWRYILHEQAQLI